MGISEKKITTRQTRWGATSVAADKLRNKSLHRPKLKLWNGMRPRNGIGLRRVSAFHVYTIGRVKRQIAQSIIFLRSCVFNDQLQQKVKKVRQIVLFNRLTLVGQRSQSFFDVIQEYIQIVQMLWCHGPDGHSFSTPSSTMFLRGDWHLSSHHCAFWIFGWFFDYDLVCDKSCAAHC